MTDKFKGRVILRYGADVLIETADGSIIRATARRKLENLVCGDYVDYAADVGNSFVVLDMHERRNALVRTYFRGQPRTMAANIDQVLVITAPLPETDWSVVDGSLIAAEQLGAEAIILQHKFDLGSSDDMERHFDAYRHIGYQVPKTSVNDAASITNLETLLSSRTAILLGQSGMGKSSLVDKLVAESKILIGQISDSSGLGKHTTSATRLYQVPGGGAIIDSPGIRDFTPRPIPPDELQHAYKEFRLWIGDCRFHNCQHNHEPGCAILAAVESGKISRTRHDGYLAQLQIWKDAEAKIRPAR